MIVHGMRHCEFAHEQDNRLGAPLDATDGHDMKTIGHFYIMKSGLPLRVDVRWHLRELGVAGLGEFRRCTKKTRF